MYAMLAHPVATGRGLADHHPRKCLIGLTSRNFKQVLPVFFFGVGIDQDVLWGIMHAA